MAVTNTGGVWTGTAEWAIYPWPALPSSAPTS